MEKYYKLAEEKVINTVTIIPEFMWERKGILPYEEVREILEVESKQDNYSNVDIQEKKVVETFKKYKIIKTEAEIKTNKINEIKMNCQMEIFEEYPIEKQLSALLGVYSEDYLNIMKTFINNRIDDSNLLIRDLDKELNIKKDI